MIKIFLKSLSRNDIWRVIGILILLIGSFFKKQIFILDIMNNYFEFESNWIQIAGFGIIFLPFIFNFLKTNKTLKEEKKENL